MLMKKLVRKWNNVDYSKFECNAVV